MELNAHIMSSNIRDGQPIRTLSVVLGDQLNLDSALWDEFDASMDVAWMAEVLGESEGKSDVKSDGVLSSQQRTVLFLSAMRHFADELSAQQTPLLYGLLSEQSLSLASALQTTLQTHAVQRVRCVLPGDVRLVGALKAVCDQQSVPLEWLADRHFVSLPGEFKAWLQNRTQPRMEYWYRQLRKRTGRLMQADGQPEGGQWNYDADNRKAFGKTGPQNLTPPLLWTADAMTQAVMRDVRDYLPNLPGGLEHFTWPVNRAQALLALDDFITHRLPYFGDHQDAMWMGEPWLFHARLSAALNLKLLNPVEVINAAEQAYAAKKADLNAVEGFIRQVLGWREYVRGLYWQRRHDWLDMNALNAQRALPELYWHGNTQMVCLQQSVQQVLAHGYGHHIQRLMVTGLFALLWGAHPKQVHEWYLAMYVDAVAWVEVPNTLGMSQFADGGLVGSKPYIASGAYIDRMSNYCKHCRYQPKQASGDQACPFTTLYWDFVRRHQPLLTGHPRLGMQVKNWHNKAEHEQHAIGERAQWLFANIEVV